MRNRAKCKLCNSIIESFHKYDEVRCECGAIHVYGGSAMFAAFNSSENFLRLDDNDTEIPITYQEKKQDQHGQVNDEIEPHKLTKEELIQTIDDMIKSYDNLPQQAMLAPATQADQLSLLMLISSLFKSI